MPDIREYVDLANELFNDPSGVVSEGRENAPYGFIEYSSNLQENQSTIIPSISIPYGFENVWYKRKKTYSLDKIKSLKEIKKRDTKIYLRDLNLITLEDEYDLFEHDVYMQNNYGALLENGSGSRIIVKRGRYSLEPGARVSHVKKRVKSELQPFKQTILLSTTIHQPKVIDIMPINTNLLPIEYAILHAWEWHNGFLKRFRDYRKRRGLPWNYIGSILQFQDDEDTNGFPHFHSMFNDRWLGDIDEIAELWPYAEHQGVDIMTKAKWEKANPGKKYSPLRLANYLSGYVSKTQFYDEIKGIHKCHAIAHFYGVRMFNMAHQYKAEKREKRIQDESWKYLGMKSA